MGNWAIYLYHKAQQEAAAAAAKKKAEDDRKAAEAKKAADARAAAAARAAQAAKVAAAQQAGTSSAGMEEELQRLEAEQVTVESMVTEAPAGPSPSAYTGGGPVTTQRVAKRVATTEEKVASLVAAHQTKQAQQRTAAPLPMIVTAPSPILPPPSAAPARQPFKLENVVSWVKNALFGTAGTVDGLGQADAKLNIIMPIVVILGLLLVLRRK